MHKSFILTLSASILLGATIHAEIDEDMLAPGILGPLISDSDSANDSDLFTVEDPGSAFELGFTDEEPEEEIAPPPVVEHTPPQVVLPPVVRERPSNGPTPTDPTLAPDYSFDNTLLDEAVAIVARDLPQPVVLEIATNLAVSGDYTGQAPVDALQNLVRDAGLQLGVYRNTIYVFEEGTANRIAQMIIRDKNEGEQLAMEKAEAEIAAQPVAVAPEKVEAVNTVATIEQNPDVSKAMSKELAKLRKQREKLLKERGRI